MHTVNHDGTINRYINKTVIAFLFFMADCNTSYH